jgi:hypothetical protein
MFRQVSRVRVRVPCSGGFRIPMLVQNSISTKVNGKPDFETEKEQSRTDNIFYNPGFDCYDG